MIERVEGVGKGNQAAENNFLPGNIPPGSEAFYNSKKFASNEMQFLSTLVSADQQAWHRGSEEIKKAITGQQ